MSRDSLFDTISELVGCHSPSGNEAEIDRLLLERLERLGEPIVDGGGNIVLRRAGREPGPLRAVLAHKDEIGALVKRVEEGGRLVAVAVGDAHPWIWGEGPVDVIGRHAPSPGCCRSAPAMCRRSLRSARSWTTARCAGRTPGSRPSSTLPRLEEAGVTAGSRIVPARSRKRPVRLGAGGEYIASYALDDKASVAALLLLAERLESPRHDVDLVFTAREEIGCHGAQWYARRTEAVAVVALEVVPVAKEYGLDPGPAPVLIRADGYGPLDDAVAAELEDAASAAGHPVRHVAVSRYGSDASKALSTGRVARSACLGVATENTHGFEIANLDALDACVAVLAAWLG